MRNQRLHWIDPDAPADAFPEVSLAMQEPDGLLAVGGDLSTERLLAAYERGIFPWYVDGQPILWWSPDPRCIMPLGEFHVSRRLARELRKSRLSVSFNRAFASVVTACAEPRDYQEGTWITDEMARAYIAMHREGWGHSVEIWDDDRLIGGIYGIAIGRAFFGESMFSRESNASKFAFFVLVRELAARDFEVFDCQVESPHLLSLGARRTPRTEFVRLLKSTCSNRRKLGDFPTEICPLSDYAPAPAGA